VLAGGESRRLGVPSKALASLAGMPLVQHVLERLSAQVRSTLLSVQSTEPQLAAWGHELVVDVVQRHRGPLTGLCSAMLRLECRGDGEWLLLCPCDAPFLPLDLAQRLSEAAVRSGQPVAVVQPVFSLWSLAVLPEIRRAVLEKGRGGLMQLLDELPHTVMDWPAQQPNPFFNINTPAELAEAGRLLDNQGGAG
jgi:molybdopterin-guanine dinucleotide biosynthesis protein A